MGFEEVTEAKSQALEKLQTTQSRQAGESVETLRSQLAEIRAVARLMEGDLRTGAEEWHRAHQQFETERRKLGTALAAMNNTGTSNSWFSQDCCYWPRVALASRLVTTSGGDGSCHGTTGPTSCDGDRKNGVFLAQTGQDRACSARQFLI
jgi:hypothetical protein